MSFIRVLLLYTVMMKGIHVMPLSASQHFMDCLRHPSLLVKCTKEKIKSVINWFASLSEDSDDWWCVRFMIWRWSVSGTYSVVNFQWNLDFTVQSLEFHVSWYFCDKQMRNKHIYQCQKHVSGISISFTYVLHLCLFLFGWNNFQFVFKGTKKLSSKYVTMDWI